jgi:hypothetical protein
MTADLAAAVFDRLLPGWREAPVVSGNRRVRALYRDDRHASLDIHPGKGTWFDRGTAEGGGAFDLARKILGEEAARRMLAEIEGRGPAPQAPRREPRRAQASAMPQVLGPPTSAQVAALRRTKRVTDDATLNRVGAKLVRWAGAEWLALPNLAGGWKCWGLDRSGRPRLDEGGKLARRNAGPVSLLVSPDLRSRNGAPLARLFDVEGESDALACVDQGMRAIVASTGGAGTLKGHEQHAEWLDSLEPAEVVVVGDLDAPGRDGANRRADWWRSRGVAVRVPSLPETLGPGGDVRDFLLGRPARDGGKAREPLGSPADLDALADAVPLHRAKTPEPRVEAGRPVVVPLASVESRAVEWLWPGRIPRGKLTILDGDPGLGKSAVALDLAARVSAGRAMPDGSPPGASGAVVLLTYEDDLGDTIRPRLEAAGGDPARVFAFRIAAEDGERLAEIPGDLGALEEVVKDHGVVLVIVDPLMAALTGDVNAHRDQDVRRALAILAKVAERTRAAVLVIRHLNKGGAAGSNPLYRGGGSIGIIAAARSALLLARDPEDPERRVLAVTKANLAAPTPALGLRLVKAEGALTIDWLGATQHSAEDLLAVPTDREERSALDEARDFLRDRLAGGPQPAEEVKRAGKAAGIFERTLERARHALGVTSRRQGFGPGATYVWWLPEAPHARHATPCPPTLGLGEHEEHGGEHGVQAWPGTMDSA